MAEITAVSGVPVVPGTALAALVATVPPELVPLMPIPLLSALATLPATALAAAIPEVVVPGAVIPGAVVPALKSDVYEKALISINATASAALSAMAVAKVY